MTDSMRFTSLGAPSASGLKRFVREFLLAALIALLTITASPAFAAGHDDERIKELAIEAILESPEIISQAIEILQERERNRQQLDIRQKVELYRQELEYDPNAPVLGNVEGDITLIEFFDYNCPYCKSVAPDLLTLIEEDPGIRLVYREWPILGEDSVFAARAALAAREQGRYEELHWALMSLRRATKESVLAAADELGIDIEKLQSDMLDEQVSAHIELSMRLANVIGLTGTPAFILGDRIVPGAVSLEEMRDVVVRHRTGQN